MPSQDIRWQQRFENFSKACALLSELNQYEVHNTPAIIREGFIHRFEVAFDLAWKTMRDLMEHEGIHVQPTPRTVVKEAFAANIIENGQLFIDMLQARNLMAHKYDENTFKTIFLQIKQEFEPALAQLRATLERKMV
ncbi:MAG: nucleotidyltransferase substrate binding protein [Oscillospiraceae bacterium]|nr:nucleotidyltransferase substrate binding protein [Oscillospiraceae bacterium]